MASSSPVLHQVNPCSLISSLAVVQQSLTAWSFSPLEWIHFIYLSLLFSLCCVLIKCIFCLLPSLLVSGVHLHSDVTPSFFFPVQALLQEWGKYITNQLMPELTVSQLGDWVAQPREPSSAPEMVSFPGGNALPWRCWLIALSSEKIHYEGGIQDGNGAERTNLLPLTEMKTLAIEGKLPSHRLWQSQALPPSEEIWHSISLSWLYFLFLLMTPCICWLCCGSPCYRQEQKGRHKMAQWPNHCIVSCGGFMHRHWAPGEGHTQEPQPQSFSALLAAGVNATTDGLGIVRRRGQKPTQPGGVITKAHVGLLLSNSLVNEWICFVFHSVFDLYKQC